MKCASWFTIGSFTRQFTTQVAISLLSCCMANAQGRPIDWPSQGGDAQRTGWEKVDTRITKDNAKDFQLVLKRKLDNAQKGPHSLTPPVVIGLLISYRGFKELAFVAGSSDNMWAIDADMDRVFWQKHFDTAAGTPTAGSGPCSGGMVATPALIPPVNFGARPPRPGVGGPGPTAAAAGGPPPTRPASRGILGPGGFGAPRPAFAVSSDGKLHLMNTSTGDEVVAAIPFLPAKARAASLTVSDNTIYATTSSDCNAETGGVWAVDLSGPESQTPRVASFPLKGGAVSHQGGLAIGNDGTVYVQTGPGGFDPNGSKWSNTLLALNAKDLKAKDYFTIPGGPEAKNPLNLNVTTPVVFAYKGRDLIVSAGADGRLYLLDSKSVGGDDHKTALCQTPPLASRGNGIWGGLSSWQDGDGTRWVFAPVWGTVNPELHVDVSHGGAPNGSIVAFKVEDKGGKTVLTPAWASRDMNSPQPPVITSGVVFALSVGEYGKDGLPKGSTHATLYALDAATGKQIYSTGDEVTTPGNLTGVTLANGRVFFTTADSTLWGFGVYMER
jgi:PQQ-like domain